MSDSGSDSGSPGIIHEFARESEYLGNHHQHPNGSSHQAAEAYRPPLYVHPYYLPGGKRSLSGISGTAFGLGIALGASLLLATELALYGHGLWRAPCFIAILAIFHFLEFDSTARYNPPDASISSFLLFSNGPAYTTAHSAAMTELLVRYLVAPRFTPSWFLTITTYTPVALSVTVGFVFILVGQLVRRAAMRQAKTNFNHVVQWAKRPDHVLVKHGVYSFSRHPSYFGFFWWGVGTQLVLGNRICLVLYVVVLWNFFKRRITHEERHLVSFFGKEYLEYRDKVPVRIPFIR